MDEEQAGAIEQAFDLDYNIAQVSCSYIVPKAVLWLTGEPPDIGIDFELEDGEGENYDRTSMRGDTKMMGELGQLCPFQPRQR